MEALLTRYGVFIKKDEFIKLYGITVYKKIALQLYIRTIVDKFRNIIRTANLIEQHPKSGSFIVPRFIGFKLEALNYIKIKNYIKPFNYEVNYNPPFTPTHNQSIIVKYLIETHYNVEKINNGSAGCILHLSAGQGKTYVFAYLCWMFNCKTLIIVPNETLLNQTESTLKNLFPNKIIGAYYGKHKAIGDINIMIIDSVIINDTYDFIDLCELNENVKMEVRMSDVDLNKFINKYLENENEDEDIREGVGLYHYNNITNLKAKNKYSKKLTKEEYYKQFNFICYDEIHEYCGKVDRKAFNKAQATCVLGLTASPNERKDGFDPIARMFIGPLIDAKKLQGYQESAFNFTSSYIPIIYSSPLEFSNSYEFYNDNLIEIMKDYYRSVLIIQLALKLNNEGRNVFVFTERRKHVIILKLIMEHVESGKGLFDILKLAEEFIEGDDNEDAGIVNDGDELIKDEANDDETIDDETIEYDNSKFQKEFEKSNFLENDKAAFLIGGVTAESERIAENNAKIIIATYQYLSTGRSIKKMDTIILAMPRKAKTLQTFGRIFRLNGDETIHRLIYDIVDIKHKFKSQFYVRKKIAVEEYKSTVENKVKIDYSQIKDKINNVDLEKFKEISKIAVLNTNTEDVDEEDDEE